MRNNWTSFAGAAVLASGMLFAQTPAPPAQPQPPGQARQWHRGMFFDRMATKLNMTDDQKQQAKSILQASRETARPIAQQLRMQRQALRQAVEAGKSDAEIDQISASSGALMAQLTANRTKAFAKVYAMLTPEQRSKAQELRGQMRDMFMNGHAHRNGGGAGL